MHPKDIIADMKTMYGIQIMYSKAHQALDYALSLTYGTHEETFQLLPSFGYVLEQKIPAQSLTYNVMKMLELPKPYFHQKNARKSIKKARLNYEKARNSFKKFR
ncbi:hypothetical protein Ddye_023577 [Dipteronia dyeriana]|uniref:Uncharacterized protein n=1 Tax=Dipteronia dyeriana TaxID=168575 RepID=A0AAD9TT90_9ROSI|nr:hypothetical protein Ddye_023577 [Dipteronia dyeriana]